MYQEDLMYNYDCCKHCNNNPKNNPNASGICNCALPAMTQTGYYGDYLYCTGNTLHKFELMTNPLVRNRGLVGMLAIDKY